METFVIVLYILLGVSVLGAVPIFFILSAIVYDNLLVRSSPDKWGRECSAPELEEHLAMWNDGVAWREKHAHRITEVSVQNEGLTLVGEFVDFGSDRTVILLPGRGECLTYSYHFAAPYERAGCNVLAIDMRCHGNSDGRYITAGIGEGRDLLVWIRFVQERFAQKEVYLHGICMGAVSALVAMTAEDCPACVAGLVNDGCFVSFRETFRRHMVVGKRPVYPVLDLVMLFLFCRTGVNVYRDKPISMVKRLPADARVLCLYGEQDLYSEPAQSCRWFEACAAQDKTIVWFEKGGHSHLRINNMQRYDDAIESFLRKR